MCSFIALLEEIARRFCEVSYESVWQLIVWVQWIPGLVAVGEPLTYIRGLRLAYQLRPYQIQSHFSDNVGAQGCNGFSIFWIGFDIIFVLTRSALKYSKKHDVDMRELLLHSLTVIGAHPPSFGAGQYFRREWDSRQEKNPCHYILKYFPTQRLFDHPRFRNQLTCISPQLPVSS